VRGEKDISTGEALRVGPPGEKVPPTPLGEKAREWVPPPAATSGESVGLVESEGEGEARGLDEGVGEGIELVEILGDGEGVSVVESEAVFFKGDCEGGSPVDEGVRAREEEMDAEGVFEREEIPKATAGVGEGILEEVGKLEKVASSPPFEDLVGISTEGEAVGVVLTVPPPFPAKGRGERVGEEEGDCVAVPPPAMAPALEREGVAVAATWVGVPPAGGLGEVVRDALCAESEGVGVIVGPPLSGEIVGWDPVAVGGRGESVGAKMEGVETGEGEEEGMGVEVTSAGVLVPPPTKNTRAAVSLERGDWDLWGEIIAEGVKVGAAGLPVYVPPPPPLGVGVGLGVAPPPSGRLKRESVGRREAEGDAREEREGEGDGEGERELCELGESAALWEPPPPKTKS